MAIVQNRTYGAMADQIGVRATHEHEAGDLHTVLNNMQDAQLSMDKVDTDPLLEARSDEKMPSQKAVALYVGIPGIISNIIFGGDF